MGRRGDRCACRERAGVASRPLRAGARDTPSGPGRSPLPPASGPGTWSKHKRHRGQTWETVLFKPLLAISIRGFLRDFECKTFVVVLFYGNFYTLSKMYTFYYSKTLVFHMRTTRGDVKRGDRVSREV